MLLPGVIADGCYVSGVQVLDVGRAFPVANLYPIVTVLVSA